MAHVIVLTLQVKPAGWRPREWLHFESKGYLLVELPFLQGKSVLSLRPPTDWMEFIHLVEGSVLYAKSTDLNVNLSQKFTL